MTTKMLTTLAGIRAGKDIRSFHLGTIRALESRGLVTVTRVVGPSGRIITTSAKAL